MLGREVNGDGFPGRQYDEIWRMAGPLRPRCVKSRFSRKRGPAACGCDDLGGEAGEVGIARAVLRLPGEGNQRGRGVHRWQDRIASDAIGEIRCAHLGNGEAAGGDDQRAGAIVRGGGMDDEAFAVTTCSDVLIEDNANAGVSALRFQHVHDVASGAVAEELAQCLLVIGDAVLLDQCDEVMRRVSGKRGAGEVRIRGEEERRPCS